VKRMFSLLSVAALGTVMMLWTAMPTPAYAAASDCPDDYVCMWEDTNYSGSMYVRYRLGSNDRDKFEIDWWDGDGEISSFVNNTDKYLILFNDDDFNGATRCSNPEQDNSSLGSWDNVPQSFVLHSSCQI
jgi:hypothetical protein